MTRRDPTPEERATAKALVSYFNDIPLTVTDVEIKDTPDLRLRLNGYGQGYELAALLPSDIHQSIKEFSHWQYEKRGKRVCAVVVPLEPHIWMKEIIEKKWKKAQEYEATEFTRNLILIIHPPQIRGDTLDYNEDGLIEQLRVGGECSTHGFFGIGYWSGKRFVWLDVRRQNRDHVKLRWKHLSRGYPAYSVFARLGTAEELQNDLSGASIGLDDLPKEQIKVLKPRSPQFFGRTPNLPKNIKYKIELGDILKADK